MSFGLSLPKIYFDTVFRGRNVEYDDEEIIKLAKNYSNQFIENAKSLSYSFKDWNTFQNLILEKFPNIKVHFKHFMASISRLSNANDLLQQVPQTIINSAIVSFEFSSPFSENAVIEILEVVNELAFDSSSNDFTNELLDSCFLGASDEEINEINISKGAIEETWKALIEYKIKFGYLEYFQSVLSIKISPGIIQMTVDNLIFLDGLCKDKMGFLMVKYVLLIFGHYPDVQVEEADFQDMSSLGSFIYIDFCQRLGDIVENGDINELVAKDNNKIRAIVGKIYSSLEDLEDSIGGCRLSLLYLETVFSKRKSTYNDAEIIELALEYYSRYIKNSSN